MDFNYEPYRQLLLMVFRREIVGDLLPLRPQDVELIEQVLKSEVLNERERMAVRMCFGIGEKKLKLTEVGKRIPSIKYPKKKGVSQSWAGNLRDKALRKIKRSNYSGDLRCLFRGHLEEEVRSLSDLYQRVERLEDTVARMNPNFAKLPTTTIGDLDLSVRTYNCLKNAGILTAERLSRVSESELRGLRNFGEKSIREIKEKLATFGVSLKR